MKVPYLASLAALIVLRLTSASQSAERDLQVTDFESTAFENWIVTGDAFGTGPIAGTLPEQNAVAGFRGRYASSYHGTDRSTGTLTSPAFEIERDAITFLIGGGAHARSTCVNLLVDQQIVRTATGHDSETLIPFTWDTRDLRGKQARIQIVDNETGRWGHVTVDHIMQTDQPVVPTTGTQPLYLETYRPQFHFTSAKNWLNDPNGCVYFDGEYHLFFQYNPMGREWGNMTWGHAVSPDLLHWTQLPDALTPDALGTMFSGSAVVDHRNTSGFGNDAAPPLVALYTAAGGTNPESKGKSFSQCIAYSTDKGRTWTKYEKNPVIEHLVAENRDPKVIWHEPSDQWIMALYLDGDRFALFSSSNLKSWTKFQDLSIPGSSECPDFFPLALDGDPSKVKWVLTAADNGYLVGDFDGQRFNTDGKTLRLEAGQSYYAVQSFSDVPDGRRIQIGWMRGGTYPHMPFNQEMSFPTTLELRTTADGPRLFRKPIQEIAALHDVAFERTNLELQPGHNPLADLKGDLFHIKMAVRPDQADAVGLNIRGQTIRYDVAAKKLAALGTADVELVDGVLTLEIIVDRTTIETFANGGARAFSSCYLPTDVDPSPLSLFSEGGTAKVHSLSVWTLKSTWPTTHRTEK